MTGSQMSKTGELEIRPLEPRDEAEWRRLWTGYLDYYETKLPEAIYRLTFARLLAGGPKEFRGRIALLDGKPVGLVHFLFHRSSWKVEEVCYLQDLYTDPDVRGQGVARALINRVYDEADSAGCPTVYWFTQDFNATARRLYDRIGVETPFLRYNRPAPFVTPSLRDDVMIRPPRPEDADAWRRLWQGYLTFYETRLPDAVTDATFTRLLSSDPDEMRGRVIEMEGRLVALVHYVQHRHCWREEKVTYLQDLFALPETRGMGLGRALIETVYAEADAAGAPSVYWLTARDNATARQLYDRVGQLTPFIEYDRPE
jgi:GNAT superfamily N-acetyltransferase